MTHYVLILAGGQGSRLNKKKVPKQFLHINKLPMLMYGIKAFSEADPKSKIYVGMQKQHLLIWKKLCQQHDFNIEHKIYIAGEKRFNTVFLGLEAICKNDELTDNIVSIHDAARPFINKKFILDLIKPLYNSKFKAVIPVISLKNAIIYSSESEYRSLNRNDYLLCQTPQCFKLNEIIKAYKSIMIEFENKKLSPHLMDDDKGWENKLHDDLTIFNKFFSQEKSSIKFIKGLDYNMKITTDLDYFISEKVQNFHIQIK